MADWLSMGRLSCWPDYAAKPAASTLAEQIFSECASIRQFLPGQWTHENSGIRHYLAFYHLGGISYHLYG